MKGDLLWSFPLHKWGTNVHVFYVSSGTKLNYTTQGPPLSQNKAN